MSEKAKIVIAGGGISGLATAYFLKQACAEDELDVQITLLEAGERLGGIIETCHRDGFLLESGPDSFITEKREAYQLCKKIGLGDDLIPTNKENRLSFVLHEGKLVPVPKGVYLTIPTQMLEFLKTPLISWKGKLRMALEYFIPPARDNEDESVASFVRRRFGREALANLGQPMIGGIYTADPEKLSLKAALPHFHELERQSGSLIKAFMAKKSSKIHASRGPRYSLFLSLKNGMESLVNKLRDEISSVELRTRSEITSLSRKEKWEVFLKNGEVLEADAVCLAVPAPAAAQILGPLSPALGEKLAGIPYESVATLNFGFKRKDVPQTEVGFGFVVPEKERRPIVGCTFSSTKFPGRAPEDGVLVRLFIGGAFHRELVSETDESLVSMARRELKEILGIIAEPLFVSVKRYRNAMPQYHVGHSERIAAIEEMVEDFPNLFLTGNAYRGIGIPDCIRQAYHCVQQMVLSLHTLPTAKMAALK